MNKYILDDAGNPVEEPDVLKWAAWLESADRTVCLDFPVGETMVSTVFLATDHNWGEGDPVLWETIVFGGPLDGEMVRYSSRADAERGHAAMVERVRNDYF